jgi:hypothetical protein
MKVLFAVLYGVPSSCTTTHVYWDAMQMREQIVDYYNHAIMHNLIRRVNGRPFVHVDLSRPQALARSTMAGPVGVGETRTRTNWTNPAMTIAPVVATSAILIARLPSVGTFARISAGRLLNAVY